MYVPIRSKKTDVSDHPKKKSDIKEREALIKDKLDPDALHRGFL
jgi:hypothetical protein